jgi:hypothetical protein
MLNVSGEARPFTSTTSVEPSIVTDSMALELMPLSSIVSPTTRSVILAWKAVASPSFSVPT